MQAIDDQMEQLATGAAKALQGLWGGLAGVAKGTLTAGHSLATQVPASMPAPALVQGCASHAERASQQA